MEEDVLLPVDVEQRAGRCIRANNLRVAEERMTALVELVKALRIKFYQNIGLGYGWIGISAKF